MLTNKNQPQTIVARVFCHTSSFLIYQTADQIVTLVNLLDGKEQKFKFNFTLQTLISNGNCLFFSADNHTLYGIGHDHNHFGFLNNRGDSFETPVELSFVTSTIIQLSLSDHHGVLHQRNKLTFFGANYHGELGTTMKGKGQVVHLSKRELDSIDVKEVGAASSFTVILSLNQLIYYLGKMRQQPSGVKPRKVLEDKVINYCYDSTNLFIFTVKREFHLINQFHIKFENREAPKRCWFFDSYLFLQADKLYQLKEGNMVKKHKNTSVDGCRTIKSTTCMFELMELGNDLFESSKGKFEYYSKMVVGSEEGNCIEIGRITNIADTPVCTESSLKKSLKYWEPYLITEIIDVSEEEMEDGIAFEMISSMGTYLHTAL